MTSDPYSIYVRSFGKVLSGAKLSDTDYGVTHIGRIFRPYERDGQVAVALAVQDTQRDEARLRTRCDFEVELRRLLG